MAKQARRNHPNPFHDKPIRIKLLLISLVTTGVALLLTTSFVGVTEYLTTRKSMLDNAKTQAQIVGRNSTAVLTFEDAKGAEEILAALQAAPDIGYAAIYAADGKLFARYRRDALSEPPTAPDLTLDGVVAQDWNAVDYQTGIWLQGEQIGTLQIRIGLQRLYQQIVMHATTLLAAGVGSLMVAFILLSRLQRSISRPIGELQQLMRRVSTEGDYSARSELASRDELGDLARGFNVMLAQIQRQDFELKRELEVRERTQARLDRLAHYDTVTGLPNRHYFNERLQESMERALRGRQALALMFLDLDNFKIVNDTMGHDAGDAILRSVSRRLSDVLRATDTIFRIGGDEFAIIVENLRNPAHGAITARKCLDALAEPFSLDGHELYLGTSIGISICPDDALDSQILLRNADTAMYFAKSSGKNTFVFFEAAMESSAQRRLSLENGLRKAIERREMSVVYQPQVDLRTCRIMGAEALVRWHSAEFGEVCPEEFIPVAEETGLISPIGEWVFRSACNRARIWHESFAWPISIAINFSGRQFRDANVVGRILDVRRECKVPPSIVELEITESTMMEFSDEVLEKLASLREAGMQLAIDDFGTGYSSIGYLKRLPITKLKIDRTFIQDLPDDKDCAAIVQAIVAMAHSLDVRVVAEGVETVAQAKFLADCGCDQAQGFLTSEPVSADEFTRLLEQCRDALEPYPVKVLADSPECLVGPCSPVGCGQPSEASRRLG